MGTHNFNLKKNSTLVTRFVHVKIKKPMYYSTPEIKRETHSLVCLRVDIYNKTVIISDNIINWYYFAFLDPIIWFWISPNCISAFTKLYSTGKSCLKKSVQSRVVNVHTYTYAREKWDQSVFFSSKIYVYLNVVNLTILPNRKYFLMVKIV